ncbi:hypothetical protein VTO73DRAFT_6555 [Trametes versicolor]
MFRSAAAQGCRKGWRVLSNANVQRHRVSDISYKIRPSEGAEDTHENRIYKGRREIFVIVRYRFSIHATLWRSAL